MTTLALRPINTGSIVLQLVAQQFCMASWKASVIASGATFRAISHFAVSPTLLRAKWHAYSEAEWWITAGHKLYAVFGGQCCAQCWSAVVQIPKHVEQSRYEFNFVQHVAATCNTTRNHTFHRNCNGNSINTLMKKTQREWIACSC